jgi:hypothetical protein
VTDERQERSAAMSVRGAAFLGIGAMIGAGIFALLGEVGAVAGSAAIGVTAVVLVFFAVDTLQNAPETFTAIAGVAALAVVLDFIWKRVKNRRAGRPATPAATASGP